MDRGAWWAITVHGVTKSQTGLSANTFTVFSVYAKEAPHTPFFNPHLAQHVFWPRVRCSISKTN